MKRRTVVSKMSAALVAAGLLLGTTSAIVPASPAEAGTCNTWQYKIKRTVSAKSSYSGDYYPVYKGWYINSSNSYTITYRDEVLKSRFGDIYNRDKNRVYSVLHVPLRDLDYITCW